MDCHPERRSPRRPESKDLRLFFVALRDPHRQAGVSQAAEKLDLEGGRGPQRRVLVAGVEGGGFNPHIKQ